ncbi:hypothetical protein CRUP_025040 [Coryphaenoides rupestris]|nr:hypothetical protein CRUP_025040 [Coryphaenoides rupestris]
MVSIVASRQNKHNSLLFPRTRNLPHTNLYLAGQRPGFAEIRDKTQCFHTRLLLLLLLLLLMGLGLGSLFKLRYPVPALIPSSLFPLRYPV